MLTKVKSILTLKNKVKIFSSQNSKQTKLQELAHVNYSSYMEL